MRLSKKDKTGDNRPSESFAQNIRDPESGD